MRAWELCEVLADIDEKYIIEAHASGAVKPTWKKWGTVAACLCLLAVGLPVLNHIAQHIPHAEDHSVGALPPTSMIGEYRIEYLIHGVKAENIKLYAYSVEPPEAIKDAVAERYPEADCSDVIYTFEYGKYTQENYWFPIIEAGRIVNIVYAAFADSGQVATAHSVSEAEELNAIAALTSKDEPLYLVATEMGNYYIIGDTAYIFNEKLGEENKYLSAFPLPDKDIITVEIK